MLRFDRDDDAGAERAGDRNRHRIDQRAVDQPAAVDGDRREDAGQRIGGADRLGEVALVQPEFVAGGEFGGDADKGALKVLDAQVCQLFAHQGSELRVADQARGTEAQVEQGQHAAARQRAGEIFQRIQPVRHEAAADQRPYGCAGHDVGLDAGAGQGAQDADMRPAAGDAGAKGDTDFRFGGGRHQRTFCMPVRSSAAGSLPSGTRR